MMIEFVLFFMIVFCMGGVFGGWLEWWRAGRRRRMRVDVRRLKLDELKQLAELGKESMVWNVVPDICRQAREEALERFVKVSGADDSDLRREQGCLLGIDYVDAMWDGLKERVFEPIDEKKRSR